MFSFNTRTEALAHIRTNRLNGYLPYGLRANGVDRYEVRFIPEAIVTPKRDIVPGATRKMSLTDRAVAALIKGQTKDQVVDMLIAHGSKPESARCTAHFVFTGKVSKAHADMIANRKWVGFNAR